MYSDHPSDFIVKAPGLHSGSVIGRGWQLLQWVGLCFARMLNLDPTSRAERELMGMTDAQLADIGINRSEIHHAVRHGRTPW
jgi:uncharacterized protein YjiS (DUF1127 family)